MIQTVEAVVDARWPGAVARVPFTSLSPCRALVTVLDEPAVASWLVRAVGGDRAPWRRQALATAWNRPEVDAAWSHLQPAKCSWSRSRSPTCRSRRNEPAVCLGDAGRAATACCARSPGAAYGRPAGSSARRPGFRVGRVAGGRLRGGPVLAVSPPTPGCSSGRYGVLDAGVRWPGCSPRSVAVLQPPAGP